MTAALVMTACSNDDSTIESPALQSTVKTIPYTVTVGQGEAVGTRATVDSDLKTLRFAAGDQLYVSSDSRADLTGVLTLKSGDEGKTSGATFEGTLTYTGDDPDADLAIKATLVGSSNVGVKITDDKVTGVTYPTAAYCDDVNDAVKKYSNLTGTSTYGAQSFTLTQQTAFLNFAITFEDGTTTGTVLNAVVSNGGSAICTASVTTTEESEKVVAKFVLPVAKGTTLSSATVKMGDKEAISFGASQTLEGKVYNVKKTMAFAGRTLAEATAEDLGKIVGADGKIYDTKADAEAVATGNAVAMIAYVGNASNCTQGLAIALADESGTMTWSAAGTACSQKTAVTGGTWRLPSIKDWQNMFISCGASGTVSDSPSSMSYSDLASKLSTAGGTALQSSDYWSSPELAPGSYAWVLYFGGSNASFYYGDEGRGYLVRACLAF